MKWADQVVVITGASEGIGASCARLMGQRGARLSLTALPGNFQDYETGTTVATAGDLTLPKTRERVMENTLRKFGRVDILINNAGVGQYGYPSEADPEISKYIFDVNVFSALALTQLAIPSMRRAGSGVIVNMGSVGGKVSLPWAVMYCATKWAMHCVDDSLRRELNPFGIHVMKVCPGIVATNFRDHVLAGKAPAAVEGIRRVVSPDQVAEGVIRGIERRRRTVYVPKIGFLFSAMEFFSPRLMDWYLRRSYSNTVGSIPPDAAQSFDVADC